MKLEKIQIKNFRGIKHLELDFQDELGRVQDQVPIIGPNTSGKTSILDAISLCLGPTTEIQSKRADLVLSPASLVRRGTVRAEVSCTVRFSDMEIAKTQEVFERTGHPQSKKIPQVNRVTVHWNYPDPRGKHPWGRNHFEPALAYLLFKGRIAAARSLYAPGVSAHSLQQLGGIFMFDQERTGLAQRMTPSMRMLASREREPLEETPEERSSGSFTRDPRLILLQLASRAQAAQGPEATEEGDFAHLRDLYARVCKPHQIKGLYNTESGLDMEFEGPKGVYLFDGLSSGQMMILLLLLQFARQRIHNSIVLIDELELHLHPLWQTRLHQSLGHLGIDNQIFFTTHSTHLRDMIRGEYFHSTGELGDEPFVKGEV